MSHLLLPHPRLSISLGGGSADSTEGGTRPVDPAAGPEVTALPAASQTPTSLDGPNPHAVEGYEACPLGDHGRRSPFAAPGGRASTSRMDALTSPSPQAAQRWQEALALIVSRQRCAYYTMRCWDAHPGDCDQWCVACIAQYALDPWVDRNLTSSSLVARPGDEAAPHVTSQQQSPVA